MSTSAKENAGTMREEAWASDPEPCGDSTAANTSERPSRVMREFLLREASELLNLAIEAEFEVFLDRFAPAAGAGGQRAVVRNGHQPSRELMTSLGPVSIRLPKVRSRGALVAFRSVLVQPYLRRTHHATDEAPEAFLVALGDGHVQAALLAVLGPVAATLAPGVTRRLNGHWQARHSPWLRGTLVPMRCEWLWFDRISFCASDRRADHSLVVVGHDHHAGARLLALRGGADSTRSWTEVLRHLHSRGLRSGFRWGRAGTVAGDVDAAIASVYQQTPVGML
jgi:hypothetical protein